LTVLSIDLASRRYADVGVCSLRVIGDRIAVAPIRLDALGLVGRPVCGELAKTVAELAARLDARLVLVDGPQAWKAPDTGMEHARVCERRLATQGKTGLPGSTKPAGYAAFTAFAVELFDRLAELGWPRLHDAAALFSTHRFALESFPTAAWRALGLRPLPGKPNTPAGGVQAKLAELCSLFPVALAAARDLTHDELQALVAGLAGTAIERDAHDALRIDGIAPFELDGTWREGFIVRPARSERR
jgi:hypothetical protein